MQKILSSSQIRQADQYTIENEPIASIDLMERASNAFVNRFVQEITKKNTSITVYCGTGNNGGDGLAIARLLHNMHYEHVRVIILQHSFKTSPDFDENLRRLRKISSIEIILVQENLDLPAENADILIDAVLGSGLNKPLEGVLAFWIQQLNQLNKKVVAVDLPTGMLADEPINKNNIVFKSDWVICFQQPKLNFLLPESAKFMSRWSAVNIGLNEHFIHHCSSNYALIEENDIRSVLMKRENFSHKGTFGHALIIAGKEETMGAALLCAEACLNSGAGLTSAYIPSNGLAAFNCRLPEVMAVIRNKTNLDWDKYTALAIGPGLGTDNESMRQLNDTLYNFRGACVFDADALNMLAEDKTLFDLVPEQAILTPHVKEFDRLFGMHENWNERVVTMQKKAVELELIIVLKNRYTIIATPTGHVYFNKTGTPAMAIGGSGDVLTGLIVALLAQGYTASQAALTGVYLHGRAGDALEELGLSVILPSNLARQINKTIFQLNNKI
ncbi:NAD(P)H-hydrate dehydratase [Solitalea lacus]|uniref:NAD(P)H-hydrate dehydratase n=1 Tax=Solitalea lacus TaxID=2911172 RepID=UPI001EDBBE6B|nr:NAD(P)H-hydrate dehydratase [Solitalea lacus]UKJ08335.1 NAD(P)H-hydrate dehydratase [Solitalea lacus]